MDESELQREKSNIQISDAIERLLANPELLSTVASAIGISKSETAASPLEKAEKPDEKETSVPALQSDSISNQAGGAKLPEAITALAPMLTALGNIKNAPDDDLSRLLCALKPYVSNHRREAIDTMVQISRLSEVFKTVK